MSVLIGPSYDLQKAICTGLRGNEDLQSLIGSDPVRLFVDAPPDAAFPYVTLGPDLVTPLLAQDYQGAEVYPELHIWSRHDDYGEIKSIGATADAVISALSGDLTEYRIHFIGLHSARHMKDPDGVTRHGVYTWRALLAPLS